MKVDWTLPVKCLLLQLDSVQDDERSGDNSFSYSDWTDSSLPGSLWASPASFWLANQWSIQDPVQPDEVDWSLVGLLEGPTLELEGPTIFIFQSEEFDPPDGSIIFPFPKQKKKSRDLSSERIWTTNCVTHMDKAIKLQHILLRMYLFLFFFL